MKSILFCRAFKHVVLIFIFLLIQNSVFASGKNEKLATTLMSSLQKKISSSLLTARSSKLLPADPSRLTIQCLDDEFQFQDIQHDVILPWQKSWKSKDLKFFSTIISKDFIAQSFARQSVLKANDLDGVSYITMSPQDNFLTQKASLEDFKIFLDNFKQISFAEIVAEKVLSSPSSRGLGQKMKSAAIFLRFNFRGEGVTDKKLEHRGQLKISVELQKNKWKMSKIEFLASEKLATNQVYFQNITQSSQASKLVPQYLRREAIRRGGYGLAVEDYNNNGKHGIFVGAVAESVLLSGDGNLKFEKVENIPLSRQTLVKAAAFADLTNAGKQDLVLIRFAPNEVQTKNDRSDIQIFKNENGLYSKREKIISFNKETAYAMPMAISDFNSDGFLDFYVGFPGSKDFTTLSDVQQSKDLASEGIFYNQKNGIFKDDSYKSFAKSHGNVDDLSKIFPHSAMAVDFNQDGQPDIVVIDDRGNLSPMYINKGDGQFEASSDKIGVGLMDYGMGIDVADLDGDGKLDFVMSSVNFNSSKRITESCSANWSVQNTIKAGVSGLRVFQANKNSTYTETTEKNGLAWVGEGSGGVKVFDYNNDGHPDIYLTSGLWTGSEESNDQDLSSYFVAASALGILEDDLKSDLHNNKFIYDKVVQNNDFKSLIFNSDSQSAVMDLLSFYRGDLRGKDKKSKAALSLAGNQPNRLFRNNGDGTFTEVGFMAGVDSIADGYMAATASLKRDGNLDLILRNADPGYKVDQFAPVEIYKNTGINSNRSVTLKLKGTFSNRDAVGAEVEGLVGKKVLVSQLIGNSGTVQSEKIIHLGLGKNDKLDKLTIRWPRGKVQIFTDVKAGFHIIEEENETLSQVNR